MTLCQWAMAGAPLIPSAEHVPAGADAAGGYSGLPVDNGPDECVTAKGFSHALCAAWHVGDNSGPHSPDEVG